MAAQGPTALGATRYAHGGYGARHEGVEATAWGGSTWVQNETGQTMPSLERRRERVAKRAAALSGVTGMGEAW
eukprot:269260-Rhodomonas_salina.2